MIKVNDGKKITIFLDMDGCISNWLQGACDLCDIDLNDEKIRAEIKERECFLGGYVDEKKLWKKIEDKGAEFWENLEIFPWAKILYTSLQELSDSFSILSSPGKFSKIAAQACYGKVLWLEKHFNNSEDYLFGYNKHLCSNSRSILIDDSNYKIDAFKKAGGNTFLWPDSLSLIDNDIDVDETIKKLVTYIKSI
jgi:hypothetical protein